MSIATEIMKESYKIEDMFIKDSPWTRPKQRINPKGGIIHWTGNIGKGANAQANRNFFNNRTGTYGSAHLIVDSQRLIAALPYMPNNAELAYHVGAKQYYTTQFGTYPNNQTIGIEMCVNRDGDFRESYKRAVWTMAHLCKMYGWNPLTDIKRHYDITHKDCPLPFHDWIYDVKHCMADGWSKADIEWMQANLKIDGVQGEKLWQKYKSDVGDVLNHMKNGTGGTVTNPDSQAIKVTKDRIYAENGILKFTANGDYKTSATDVHYLKLPKGTFKLKFVWEQGAKVSDLVKKYGADYGFNFPYFYNGQPVSDVKIGNKVVADVSTGKTTIWNGLKYSNNLLQIGKVNIKDQLGEDGFIVKGSPLLVESASIVYDKYVKIDQTQSDITDSRCQRTLIGKDASGNLHLAFADGRTSSDRGMTLQEAALYMKHKGCVTALNGDGGGSTILADKTGGLNQSQNIGKNERVVNHAVLVYLIKEEKPVADKLPNIQKEVNVDLNNGEKKGKGYLIDNTTYVPLRQISELFGAKIAWDAASNTAKIIK
ncbi:phosphodiester glycosidase family protein [Paenibacillus alvei]|uniref:phosphodiester glycosidase family protein n=1 Tax=Paenibacillus alvei TaxID=44250 RepID=UPI00227F12D4|nr:phosphodiester glycosidase family protein [Paenibacillus alvei]MCY9737465.1 phosphodiester glycosidase family protein [Paenibacillus alvei]